MCSQYIYVVITMLWAFLALRVIYSRKIFAPKKSVVCEEKYALEEKIRLAIYTVFCIFSAFFLSTVIAARSIAIFSSFVPLEQKAQLLLQHIFATVFSAIFFCSLHLTMSRVVQRKICGIDIVSCTHLLHMWGQGVVSSFLFFPLFTIFYAVVAYVTVLCTHCLGQQQSIATLFSSAQHMTWLSYLGIVTISLFGPFVEEYLFRGILQTCLNTVLSPFFSISITNIAFSWMHYMPEQKSTNYPLLITLFFFGVLCSFLRRKSQGGLLCSFGFHCGFNALSVLMMYIV